MVFIGMCLGVMRWPIISRTGSSANSLLRTYNFLANTVITIMFDLKVQVQSKMAGTYGKTSFLYKPLGNTSLYPFPSHV